MFIEVTVIKNVANERENRIINVNHIIQVFQPNDRENILKVYLLNTEYPIIVESTLKEFKIKINQIKK
jgi:tRNA A22 N-methylase